MTGQTGIHLAGGRDIRMLCLVQGGLPTEPNVPSLCLQRAAGFLGTVHDRPQHEADPRSISGAVREICDPAPSGHPGDAEGRETPPSV